MVSFGCLLDTPESATKNPTNNQIKHIAAYLLLQTGGNASPSASDIKTLLETVGIEADQAQLDKLISELEGKDINQVSFSVQRVPCFAWTALAS